MEDEYIVHHPGGAGDFKISRPGVKSAAKDTPDYKYSEGRLLREIAAYIDGTYNQHYSKNKFQATEFIIDSGHGTGFCMGNILKYAQRYGRKDTPKEWRQDMMKVIHYAIMQLHIHDQEHSDETIQGTVGSLRK